MIGRTARRLLASLLLSSNLTPVELAHASGVQLQYNGATDTLSYLNNVGAWIQINPTATPAAGTFRTLQSFGAVGDGLANDTAAVQTALNSGLPLVCVGSFVIDSLVTITNQNIFLQGGGNQPTVGHGCKFILNTTSSMFYVTNNSLQTIVFKDALFSVNAQISSVSGPAHTAALFINYPNGTNGVAQWMADIENVAVQPTSSSNYILNGVYFNDVGPTKVEHFSYLGDSAAWQANSNGLVYDGTHSPSVFTVNNSFGFYVGNGVYIPQEATGGPQGIRVHGFDCVWCDIIFQAEGSGDHTSDHLDLSSIEGTYNKWGIVVNNWTHQFIHDNYMFAAKIAIQTTQTQNSCIQSGWTISIPSNGATTTIDHNECDGAQYAGLGATRYGVVVNGISRTPMASIAGPNILTNFDTGTYLVAGTAGVLYIPGETKGTTTPITNGATAGDNTQISVSSY